MASQTKSPSAFTVVSRGGHPGGGWAGGTIPAVDVPWNSAIGMPFPLTSGNSDLLVATGFGFTLPGADMLTSITLAIQWVTNNSLIGFPPHTFGTYLGISFDQVQLYNSGLLGTLQYGTFHGVNSSGTDSFSNAWGVAPSIAAINGAGFGIAIGAAGSCSTNFSGTPSAPQITVSSVSMTVNTQSSSGHGGGGPGPDPFEMPPRGIKIFPAATPVRIL